MFDAPLGEGATVDDLLEAYPRLTRQDVQALLTYAAESLSHEETFTLEAPVAAEG
jgi:uncharacterized protein (DUF433 family)